MRLTVFKQLAMICGLIATLIMVAGCSPYVSWKEEVLLNDGKTTIVEQKRLDEGDGLHEAWLTIHLSQISANPIVWHEHLDPLNLNVDHGTLYVVGVPSTGREVHFYGCPEHGAVGFKWEGGRWAKISFAEIPVSIYPTNLLILNLPPKGTRLLTIKEKWSSSLNGDGRAYGQWALDPNRGNNC